MRFRDDLGKFQFAHSCLHFPLFGYHGSFILIRGSVENAVTWDTECLAEDLWFSIEVYLSPPSLATDLRLSLLTTKSQAWKAGFSSGFIPGVAREQSNWTIRDLCRQRRRWFWGLCQLGWIGMMNNMIWICSSVDF